MLILTFMVVFGVVNLFLILSVRAPNFVATSVIAFTISSIATGIVGFISMLV